MRAWLCLFFILAACGAPAPRASTTPPLADPAMRPLAFMVGAWRADDGTIEIWTPAGDALFGVTFTGGGFECVVLSTVEGVPTYHAMPGGKRAVPFRLESVIAGGARFTNPSHDHPQLIRYARTGDTLVATVSMLDGTDPLSFRFTRVDLPAAPDLVEADRRFAADRDPIASGLAPTAATTGALGFTVGTTRPTPADTAPRRGAYVTIWRRQDDGTWSVLFDTGDDV